MCSHDSLLAVIFFVLLANLTLTSNALKCYKCTILPPPIYSNETHRLCSNFDYSEKFIIDCPYSTLCMKKTFTVYLPGPINGTIRDCAPQRYDYQEFKNGSWQMQVAVVEPYKEGCFEIDDKGQRISKPLNCYCRGELCNSSNLLKTSPLAYVATLFVILGCSFILR